MENTFFNEYFFVLRNNGLEFFWEGSIHCETVKWILEVIDNDEGIILNATMPDELIHQAFFIGGNKI